MGIKVTPRVQSSHNVIVVPGGMLSAIARPHWEDTHFAAIFEAETAPYTSHIVNGRMADNTTKQSMVIGFTGTVAEETIECIIALIVGLPYRGFSCGI